MSFFKQIAISCITAMALSVAGCAGSTLNGTMGSLTLTSSAFKDGEMIPAVYTCDGTNMSPPLAFTNVPEKTVSLALIMDDHDVPKTVKPDGVFDHWVVFNIPPTVTGIEEGKLLPGVYGANGSGQAAYTGPCPPDREHTYTFKLYAVDSQLSLQAGVTKDAVLAALSGHTIAEATLTGKYNRPQNMGQ